MKAGKKLWILLSLLSVVLAAGIFAACYRNVDGRFYPRNAQILDLRGKDVTPAHYNAIRQAMPDTEILWDIPLQGNHYPMDTQILKIETLTGEDVQTLAMFPELKTVDANRCRDYENLAALRELCPDLTIYCTVTIGGRTYFQNAQALRLEGVTEEELSALACLPDLKKVVAGGRDTANYDRLQAYCQEKGIAFSVNLGTQELSEDTREVTLANATEAQLELLRLLPELTAVHLREPRASAEAVKQLAGDLPQAKVTWEKTVLGMTFSWDVEEIDLSEVLSKGPDDAGRGGLTAWEYNAKQNIHGDREERPSAVKVFQHHPLPDRVEDTRDMLAELEEALLYFPNVKQLVMCGARLNNLAMGEFREAHREDFKLVWTVQCGQVATRTDATYFMPTKFHVYYFYNQDAYNLRYCEDIISLDIGHMPVHDISFVKNMPNLKYLILAHTSVMDITPLASCKNLVFLEVDHTAVLDLTPLQSCTALEDLNVGNTSVDLTPLKQMTWLKNLWMVFRGSSAWELSQALPDTHVVASGNATVDSGWRYLPNYYAMRDELKMYYMPW